MKMVERKVKRNWVTKTVEKKSKGNWIVKIEAEKHIAVGTVTYTTYVFDRTLRQLASIQKFYSLQEAKFYFNNLIKK